MAGWLLRESGAKHPGSTKRFECGVHGALTVNQECPVEVARNTQEIPGAEAKERDAGLFTFLVTASGVSFLWIVFRVYERRR